MSTPLIPLFFTRKLFAWNSVWEETNISNTDLACRMVYIYAVCIQSRFDGTCRIDFSISADDEITFGPNGCRIVKEKLDLLIQRCAQFNLRIAYFAEETRNRIKVILTFLPHSDQYTGNYFCDSALEIARSIQEVLGIAPKWLKDFNYSAEEFAMGATEDKITSLEHWLKQNHPSLN